MARRRMSSWVCTVLTKQRLLDYCSILLAVIKSDADDDDDSAKY